MNVAEVKRTLNNCWRLEMKLKMERATLEHLRAAASKATPSYSLVSGGGGVGQKIENCVLDIVEWENTCKATINSYVEAKTKTLDLIELLPDARLKSLLRKRYLNYKKWETIAVDLNLSYRRVHQLHSKALNLLANHT